MKRWLEGCILQHTGRGRKDGRKGKTSQGAGALENGYDIHLGTGWRMSPHPGIITRNIFIAGFQNCFRLVIAMCLSFLQAEYQ